MASQDPQVNAAVCAVTTEVRSHGHNSPHLAGHRSALAVAKIEDFIRRTVDAAPELSNAQRARISTLLAPVGGGIREG